MALTVCPSEISVLLLFNLDPDWPAKEQEEVISITSSFEKAIATLGYQTNMVPVTASNLNFLSKYSPLEHVVFNLCESLPGVRHSEWLVADFLEQRGFTFTGASAATIALAQDKYRLKQLLDVSEIMTPRWQTYNRDSVVKWKCFPAIVKPSMEHCSEGIDRNAVCTTQSELINRVNYIIEEFRQPAMVEDFIDGRELHVSLWGNGRINVLPPAEMEFSFFTDPHDRLCTYESKFVPESIQYQNINTVLPASLSENELCEVERLCKAAYKVAECRDYARIDLRIMDGLIYILDVNPNPDISPDTSTVSAAELIGYTYGELGEYIVQLAVRRHPIWGRRVYCGNTTVVPT